VRVLVLEVPVEALHPGRRKGRLVGL
jgi:hypothetical protein